MAAEPRLGLAGRMARPFLRSKLTPVVVLASIGLVLATAWLGTLLFDRRSALAGGLVLATTLAFLSFARMAMSDVPLALWTTLAVALAVVAVAASPTGSCSDCCNPNRSIWSFIRIGFPSSS